MSSVDGVESSLVAHGVTWDSFGLDPRLTRAIQKLAWSNPTLVQSASIPRVLQGKDVLAKARTGSGKTAAYAVPLIQKILSEKEGISVSAGIRALVLVPTRELCEQVSDVVTKLVAYCHHLVRHVFLANDTPMDTQAHRLAELPDLVISTPGRLVQHLERGSVKLAKTLKMIVVDEADLVFSYGYEQDMEKISKYLPKICQGFLASATLGAAVDSLKKLILHTPVILKLEEEKDTRLLLQQYMVKNHNWNEKFLQLYVLLKLKVITGKTIVFVNSIEGCYRLKLFLERLSVKSAVLNSELPQNSRYHIVQEFNKGLFSILIATDEANKGEADDSDSESSDEENAHSDSDEEVLEDEGSESELEEVSSDDGESSSSEEMPVSKKANKKNAKEEVPKKKVQMEVPKKSNKKKAPSPSSSEDESESGDMESFEEDDEMDLDGDDDIEDMGSDSEEESDDEDMTSEAAKKEAQESIETIDAAKSVSKSALKVMQEHMAAINKAKKREEEEDEALERGGGKEKAKTNNKYGKKKGGQRSDAEYGVSRGVDFRGIKTVVNFDFPRSSRAYTHRVGRTARAGQTGTALSFVTERDAALLAKVEADQKAAGLEIKPYVFNQAALDSFRYRIEGVMRTVTDLSIREARYEEIRREILGSQKLQTFFEENPREMELLKHDKSLLEAKINPRLKTVPEYIMTPQTRSETQPLQDRDFEEEYLEHFGARRKRFGKRRMSADPLKTFSPSSKRRKGDDSSSSRGGKRGGRGGGGRGGKGRRQHVGVGSGYGPGT